MDYKALYNFELLSHYNHLRDELSELDYEDNFDEYCELETELESVFAELEKRGI